MIVVLNCLRKTEKDEILRTEIEIVLRTREFKF